MLKPSAIIFYALTIMLALSTCTEPKNESNKKPENAITCDDSKCYGTYIGPEFVDRSDVAHQFSNKMSSSVGDKLKELYDRRKYAQDDFSKIEMTTAGMGTGKVEYMLIIPLKQVASKCEAYTSFDHVGGWNHKPELEKRKEQLKPALLQGDELYISDKKTTKEGLQEYWIQWRNNEKQLDCKKQ